LTGADANLLIVEITNCNLAWWVQNFQKSSSVALRQTRRAWLETGRRAERRTGGRCGAKRGRRHNRRGRRGAEPAKPGCGSWRGGEGAGTRVRDGK
jgi:hypothetical protein